MNDMRKRALTGAGWTVAARLARAGIGIATLSLVSRFLGPAEFGIATLVIFVTGMAQVLVDFGTRLGLVQRPEVTPLEEHSVFWANLAFSVLAAGLLCLFAEPLAHLLGEPLMAEPLRWVSPFFVIVSLGIVPLSRLERRMAFGQIALADMGSSLAGALAVVVLALAGFGVGALIAQQLVMAAAWLVAVSVTSGWRPALTFSLRALRPILAYGSYITGGSILSYVAGYADRPLIGNRLSATDVGYLSMGAGIVSSPLRIVGQMVRKVMFPIMARVQEDDARMRQGILGMQYALILVMAPLCCGIGALAEPVVRLLLGPGWDEVARIMPFMVLTSLFAVFYEVNAIVFTTKGKARFQFYWSLFFLAANVAALLVAVSWGLLAAVIARMAVNVILAPVQMRFSAPLIGLGALRQFRAALRPLASAALMALAVHGLDQQVAAWPVMARLLLGAMAGAALYIALELAIDGQRVRPLLAQGARRLRRGGARAPL